MLESASPPHTLSDAGPSTADVPSAASITERSKKIKPVGSELRPCPSETRIHGPKSPYLLPLSSSLPSAGLWEGGVEAAKGAHIAIFPFRLWLISGWAWFLSAIVAAISTTGARKKASSKASITAPLFSNSAHDTGSSHDPQSTRSGSITRLRNEMMSVEARLHREESERKKEVGQLQVKCRDYEEIIENQAYALAQQVCRRRCCASINRSIDRSACPFFFSPLSLSLSFSDSPPFALCAGNRSASSRRTGERASRRRA